MNKIHTVKSTLGRQKNTIKTSLGETNAYYKQWRRQGEFTKLKKKKKKYILNGFFVMSMFDT